jgi:hypothetical protein
VGGQLPTFIASRRSFTDHMVFEEATNAVPTGEHLRSKHSGEMEQLERVFGSEFIRHHMQVTARSALRTTQLTGRSL